jgi:hypothetical protein
MVNRVRHSMGRKLDNSSGTAWEAAQIQQGEQLRYSMENSPGTACRAAYVQQREQLRYSMASSLGTTGRTGEV